MNQKIFAALLLIPVAVFATDRIVSSDGGGKEKQRTSTTQQSSPEASTTADPTTETKTIATLNQPEAKQAVRLDTREAVDEMKALLDSLESGSMPILEEMEREYIYASSDAVSSDTINWLMKNVLRPLKENNPMTIRLDRSFSRCPSGYHVEILSKEGRPTGDGLMVLDDGCWDRPIGIFRYDMISHNVEVQAGDRLGYLPLESYLKLLKSANA